MSESHYIPIRCPWMAEHSSDSGPSETVYFPAGTGSFECGHFRCLHASHEGKTDSDFLQAIGYTAEGFETIDEPNIVELFATAEDFMGPDPRLPAVVHPHPLDLPAFDRQPKTSKIKPHINNLLLFVNWLCEQGEGVRFDVFRDEILLMTPQGERAFTDADYTRLQVHAEHGQTGFAPLNMELIRRVVHMVAQNACFDSAQAWVSRLPEWDGVARVDTFCHHYLGAALTDYSVAVGRYLWSAMPGRILQPGVQADMAVILVSAQGTGKSSSVRAIAPMQDYYIDLSLSDRDADLARLTRGKSLVELSELRGLHTKEMDSIKSFVTRLDSEWIPKYFEMRTIYHRRFIMIGTTNNDEFLGDATGERRWLPLRVGVQDVIGIKRDHAQLWAEGRVLFLQHGILWKAAQMLGVHEHAEFSMHDVLVDQIGRWLETEEFGEKPSSRGFLQLVDIMKEALHLDSRECTRPNQLRTTDAMQRLGYVTTQKWLDGRNQRVWVKKPSGTHENLAVPAREFL